jgi:hypothetical protein
MDMARFVWLDFSGEHDTNVALEKSYEEKL